MKRLNVLLAVALFATLGVFSNASADDQISAANYYAAYYDGHYGDIADGYWGRHGKVFWYQDHAGNWHQDDGSHFQHEPASGFVVVHGSGAPRQH